MNSAPDRNDCEHAELVCAYAMEALPSSQVPAVEDHIASCARCRQELQVLRPTVDRFVSWPTDLLRAPASLQARLASRIAQDGAKDLVLPPARRYAEPVWQDVAPGIACKLLARDTEDHRISMLVRLAPGASYPPHTHADVEELHLLDGELWIEDRLLKPGDYNRGAPGGSDKRVWSETGCTCVLITSERDLLS